MLIWLTIQITQVLFGASINTIDSGLAIAAGIEIFVELIGIGALIFSLIYGRIHRR